MHHSAAKELQHLQTSNGGSDFQPCSKPACQGSRRRSLTGKWREKLALPAYSSEHYLRHLRTESLRLEKIPKITNSSL